MHANHVADATDDGADPNTDPVSNHFADRSTDGQPHIQPHGGSLRFADHVGTHSYSICVTDDV